MRVVEAGPIPGVTLMKERTPEWLPVALRPYGPSFYMFLAVIIGQEQPDEVTEQLRTARAMGLELPDDRSLAMLVAASQFDPRASEILTSHLETGICRPEDLDRVGLALHQEYEGLYRWAPLSERTTDVPHMPSGVLTLVSSGPDRL